MPLTRARDDFLPGPEGIRFLMQAGQIEVPCRIPYEVLSSLGEIIGLSKMEEVFVVYRHRIERAASTKYDRVSRRAYETLILTLDDLDQCAT
jgi:hypothetical protein